MTILVDEPRWPWRGTTWCHLVSDESYDELHNFARSLGLRRVGFQGDHYDIDVIHHGLALQHGAQSCESRELVRRLRTAGLRQRPRQFEKWSLVEEFSTWSTSDWLAKNSSAGPLASMLFDWQREAGAACHGFQLRRTTADALVLAGYDAPPMLEESAEDGVFRRLELVPPFRWSVELITPAPRAVE